MVGLPVIDTASQSFGLLVSRPHNPGTNFDFLVGSCLSTGYEAALSQENPTSCTTEWVFKRYEAIRHRLPTASFRNNSTQCRDLGELTDRFDVFLFDSFGVLNVGEAPIPGAKERLHKLRKAGKRLAVLTNAATGPLSGLVNKYTTLGFDFCRNEIISSREVLTDAVAGYDASMNWAVAAPQASQIDELGIEALPLGEDNDNFDAADGFILLSSKAWTDGMQKRLHKAMTERHRPLLVGNPDLAAPRENGFSVEPGTYAHAIADRCNIEPQFFGKPFGNAFEKAIEQIAKDVSRHRIAMVGDTLHTDILGGAAAGLGTILVTDYGVLRDLDLQACIASSGIVPDYIVPSI